MYKFVRVVQCVKLRMTTVCMHVVFMCTGMKCLKCMGQEDQTGVKMPM
jgi:hypothetical protein